MAKYFEKYKLYKINITGIEGNNGYCCRCLVVL